MLHAGGELPDQQLQHVQCVATSPVEFSHWTCASARCYVVENPHWSNSGDIVSRIALEQLCHGILKAYQGVVYGLHSIDQGVSVTSVWASKVCGKTPQD